MGLLSPFIIMFKYLFVLKSIRSKIMNMYDAHSCRRCRVVVYDDHTHTQTPPDIFVQPTTHIPHIYSNIF